MAISGMQKCSKCGQDKVAINEAQKCLKCEAEPGTSTLVVTCEDPGEEKMRQMLAASGVSIPKVKAEVPVDRGIGVPKAEPIRPVQSARPVMYDPPQTAAVGVTQFEVSMRHALAIMKGLTMPKDIRQFKTISKIIVQMESLVGEGK